MISRKKYIKNFIYGIDEYKYTPLYGWFFLNCVDKIEELYGSLDNFYDYYDFDLHHITIKQNSISENVKKIIKNSDEDKILDFLLDTKKEDLHEECFISVKDEVDLYGRCKDRFVYAQSPGIFESTSSIIGIENCLLNLVLNEQKMQEVFRMQYEWNIKYYDYIIDLGVDMIQISDDFGSQNSLLFSAEIFEKLVYPYHKKIVDHIHRRGKMVSLHSDGHIMPLLKYIRNIGYDMIHPFQVNAGNSYSDYKKLYKNDFGILGGLCVQSVLGQNKSENEIVEYIKCLYNEMRDTRWIFCTSHQAQQSTTAWEIKVAYDTAYELSNKSRRNK